MRRGRILATVVAAMSCGGLISAATAGPAVARPVAPPKAVTAAASTAQSETIRRALRSVAASAPRRRGGAGSAATALGLAASTPTSASVTDVAGDNAPSFDARGDIRAAAVGYGKSIAVGVALEEFDDPSTSENWQGYALGNPDFIVGTGIVWGLDVNDDQVADFNAVMVSDGVNVIAGVTNADGSVILCSGSPSWVAASNAYYVAFTPSCIGSAAHVRAQGFMIYETAIDISSDSTTWTRQVLKPGATTHPASPKSGYWMLGSDGQVYPFGGAVGFSGMVAHAAAMAPRKDGKGYWVVDHTGHVFAYGTAKFFGGAPELGSGEFVSTISATPDGGGYWLFTNKGRAFPFGDAHSFGDMTGTHLNGPIVASVATPSGHGYYMVGSDGGIFCFGDAHFHGSTGNLRLNRPVVGISPTPNGNGYWLVASDGGVFAFNAPFRGSMGGAHLNKAVDGLVAFRNGYLMAASDGGVFDFSNKPFLGSLATRPPTAPIIGLAAFST